MELKVHLVWGKNSLPDNAIRLELRRALIEMAVLPCWQEYYVNQKNIPSNYTRVKRNAIFVNEHKVYGSDTSPVCGYQELAQRIINFSNYPKSRKKLHINASLVPAVLMAIFPKCPFCFAAYLGVLGITSIEALPYYNWLVGILALSLISVIVLIIFRARQRNMYLPVYFVLPGTAMLIIGKLLMGSRLLVISGLALIFLASVMNAIPSIQIKRVLGSV